MAINMKAFSRLEKRVKKRNEKQRIRNIQYAERKQAKQNAEAIATNRQIQKQVGKSKVGRAIMGAVYGFNTGMAPLSYSKKAADLGYQAYTPSAAAAERGDTSKKTAAFNKELEKSKTYKTWNTVGNVGATALQFIIGGLGTKQLAEKALSTGAAKTAQKKTAEKLAKWRLTRALLKKQAANTTRGVTKNTIKEASRKLTGTIYKNAAEDIASDMTVGLYRDLAQARSQGVDVKDVKQLAPYLGKQMVWNTAIGSVTNGAMPAIKSIKRNKALWKTVEERVKGADGVTHVRYKKVLRNPVKAKSVKDQLGNDIDIISPKLHREARNQSLKQSPGALKQNAVADAVNNGAYVSEIRRKGINGKSVRQLADEQNRSVYDIISEDYQKRYGRTLETSRKLNRTVPKRTQDVSAELGSNEIGTRAVNRGNLRSAYETTAPNSGKYLVRNADGRLVAHRATGEDMLRADNMRSLNNIPQIKAQRQARLRNIVNAGNATDANVPNRMRYVDDYIPEHDINDLRYTRKLSDAKAEKYLQQTYGMDAFEYGRQNGMQREAVLRMAKDKLAEQLDVPKMTAEQRQQFADALNQTTNNTTRKAATVAQPDVKVSQAEQPSDALKAKLAEMRKTKDAGQTVQQAGESSKYSWDKVDRFGDRKVSPEMRELDDYLHKHPAFQRYNRIDELKREEQALIDAKKSISDTAGNDRLDAIEAELEELGAYEPYFENNRYETARSIGEIFNLNRTTKDSKRIAELEKQLEPEIQRSRQSVVSRQVVNQAAEEQATQTAKAAQSIPPEQAARRVSEEPDITMGGTRSGSQSTENSQSVETIARMRGNTKEEAEEIRGALDESGFGKKFKHTDDELINEATDSIRRDGLDETRVSLRDKFNADTRWNDVDVARAEILINRYDDIETAMRAAGNTEAAEQAVKSRDEVAMCLAADSNEAGKRLRANKLFSKLSPEGRANAIYMMKAKLQKKFGIKNIKTDTDLVNMLRDAKSEADQQYIKDQIMINLWDQIPPTITEKMAGWRYMSMLLNPKTHIRNIVGNAIFTMPRGVKNILAAGMEKTLKGERSKAILNPLSNADNKLINRGLQDWDRVKNSFLNNTAKYDRVFVRPEGSKLFKNKLLQKAYEFNSNMLNSEDEFWAKLAYSRSYAQYLKANKVDVSTASQKILKDAQSYAWDEALTSTYREANALANLINRVRKGTAISVKDILREEDSMKRSELIGRKVAGAATDTVVPFVKTPANILKSGINYSPLGIVRGLAKIAVAKDPRDKIKAIDALAQGMTGSGIFALGMYAAQKGAARASIGLDEKGYYDMDRGEQEFSITLGNDTLKKADWFDLLNTSNGKDVNIKMDSAAPAAMAFFSGVELGSELFGENSGGSVADKGSAIFNVMSNALTMADPVFEMSMLSSLREALNTAKAEEEGVDPITKVIINGIQSRAGQYVPTVMSQITKTADKGQRSQDSIKKGAAKGWDKFKKQQMNKIPGLAQMNPLKTDVFGNVKEEKTEKKNYVQSFLKNAVSPFNVKGVRETKVDKELQKLIDRGIAPKEVLPERQYIDDVNKRFGDLKFDIGDHELAEYNNIRGKASLKGLTQLIKTDKYKKASDEEKLELIKDVYKDATEKAKKKFAMDQGVSEYDYNYGTLTENKKKKFNDKYKELKETGSGISKKQYMKIFNKMGEYYDRDDDKYNNSVYVAKTLAAVKLGVESLDEAKIASGADRYGTTWGKILNLNKRGFTEKQAYEYAMTNDQIESCRTPRGKYGDKVLDERKLALFINKMNIPQKEKWARFEVNRTKSMRNPF